MDLLLAQLRSHADSSNTLAFASDELRSDKEFLIKAMRINGLALEHADSTNRNAKEVVMEATRQNGNALAFASDRLRSDPEVISTAVSESGTAGQYAVPNGESTEESYRFGISFNLSNKLLLAGYCDDFERYARDGMLTLRGDIWMGVVGIEGKFGLRIPPSGKDIDAWEASISAGQEDWWGFIGMITVPANGWGNSNILIYVENNTFFDMAHQILATIEISECIDVLTLEGPVYLEVLYAAWGQTWKLLQSRFDARDLKFG